MKIRILIPLASACLFLFGALLAQESSPESRGVYRLPFADGLAVRVFDDFTTHRPRGRIDLFAVDEIGRAHV